MADAMVVQLSELGPAMKVTAPKMAYSVFRPASVARANVIPWICCGDVGQVNWPFDLPKGTLMTSLTRGGGTTGVESPEIAKWVMEINKEPDINRRIAINKELLDYIHYWMLGTGIVARVTGPVYNPKSIAEWPHPPTLDASARYFANIVPVAR
jgi:ABC-type transport system substrate-binding protein